MTVQTGAMTRLQSGKMRSVVMLSGVTGNDTSDIYAVHRGDKTFMSEITGTGAVSATVTYYGSNRADTSRGVPLDTHALSGTDEDFTGSEVVINTSWSYIWAVITGISGTGAAVTAIMAV